MKHRDIFRVPARLEQRSQEWFMIVTLGNIDYAFHYGAEKPTLQTKMINLILEYSVADEVV